ncbi:TIGR04053 family radical SAM/SPASM domain-containing protein [Halalkalibacter krulwichiae]|uniref:Antilisterial bacteriocin subtilosin biosynthesis protein AlbA n=1 Tax=Halalkalibacter krulwichiae TaxID=199441 RepID=A0A1X9MAJ3_9BACI|nr:TIGR04053 family radical SAM/SPASM domain-containing protein [Halalkalibacter krulwichiae]ARK30427.1 Antilisterial bacteriocin subtilosin biosynthesis protein AlbA [Halalkalibacter krulwichiae]
MIQQYHQNPFIVIWEVTRACALKCLHCRAEAQHLRDSRELTLQEGKALIDQIYQMNNPLLVLTGGDPLVREDLFELIEHAVKRGVRISMTPSATPRVTKKVMEKAKVAGLSRWAFSLDGHNRDIHDHFRGTKGSFDLTMKAIRHLKELKMPLQINTVVSKFNVKHMREIAELVSELEAVLWSVFFLVPTGRGKNLQPITPDQHEEVMNWLVDLKKTASFDIKTTEAPFFRRVLIQRQGENSNYKMNSSHLDRDCLGRAQNVNDGNGFLFISHIGDVFPSGFLPINCGNIRINDLATIYREHPVFTSLRNPSLYKGKCGTCEYKFICGGSRARAFAVTGDYLESEPYCNYIPRAVQFGKVEKAD